MTESQSRYGIMEEFNDKKLKAKSRLALLVKAEAEDTMKFNQKIQSLESAKRNADANYEFNHENWKVNKEMEANLAKKELEAVITNLEQEIEDKEASYVGEHEDNITGIETKIKEYTTEHAKFVKLNTMDKEAVTAEVKEIDKAIKSLQEMSKGDSA